MIKMSETKKGLLNMLVLIPTAITAILMSAIIAYRVFNNINSSFGEYIVDGMKIYGLIIALELIIGVIIALLNPFFKGNTKKTISVITVVTIMTTIGVIIYKIWGGI